MPYDMKSDMWSLGCVLYESIMLKPPFRAEDMQGLYKKVVKGNVMSLQEATPKFHLPIQKICQMW